MEETIRHYVEEYPTMLLFPLLIFPQIFFFPIYIILFPLSHCKNRRVLDYDKKEMPEHPTIW